MGVRAESIVNEKVSIEWFARRSGRIAGRPVINRRGFKGSFKVHLEFAQVSPNGDAESTKPSILAALGEQLGFKLDSERGTEEVLVIDHIEKPAEN